MTVRYRILFSIELLHDYYSNLKCTDLVLVPSADTKKRLQAGQMLCKTVGNLLVVLIKVNDEDKPNVGLSADLKLGFYIDIISSSFINKSNISLEELRDKRIYLSNLSQNKSGATLYLSQPLDNYNGATNYTRGTIISNGGTSFECINAPVSGHATGEADYWYNRGAGQFITGSDMITLAGGIRNFTLSADSDVFNIEIKGFNTAANDYTETVLAEVRTTTATTNAVQVDMRHLSPGKYIADINGESFSFYLDTDAVYSNVAGVVEIFGHLAGTDDFALLDNNGKVKEHKYTIRFANRIAQWKYLTTKQGVKNINDTGGTYTFVQQPAAPAAAAYFESDKPIPLQQSPFVFELELNAPLSEPPPAPNPNPDDGSMLILNGDQYICKIYLNY